MKILKILGGILLTLIILFFVVGFFLPATYHVSRSIEINKPDSVVYQKALDFNDFAQWNPWIEMEPTAKVMVTGNGVSVGSVFSWVGKEIGTGSMTIEKLDPYKQIDERLNFIEPFESTAMTSFYFEPLPNGNTKVTWDFKGTSASVVEKWMSLTFDGMVGKDYAKGLSNLKAFCEK